MTQTPPIDAAPPPPAAPGGVPGGNAPIAPPEHGIKGFLNAETAGMPNWAWLIVIGVGVAAALFLPRIIANFQNNQAASDAANNPGGVGLAIDPTTGLPLAAEGFSPAGAFAGGGNTSSGTTTVDFSATNKLLQQILDRLNPKKTNHPKKPTRPEIPPIGPALPPRTPATPGGVHIAPGPGGIHRFITVGAWPGPFSSFSDIARRNGVSVARLEQLNPGIEDPNLIHPGQEIAVS